MAAAALCCAQVQGAQLKSARSFANTDKTRVVFDLSGKISWKGTTLKDGRFDELDGLVPDSTLRYFESPEAAPVLERIRSEENVIHY